MYKTAEQIAASVLSKIAKDAVKKEPFDPGTVAVRGAGLGSLAGLPFTLGANSVSRDFMGDISGGNHDAKDLMRKFKKFEPAAGMHLNEIFNVAQSSYAPKPTWYTKKILPLFPALEALANRQQINLTAKVDPFVAAHEVGHASGGKLRQALGRHRIPLTLASSLGGLGLLGHAAITGKEGEGMGATGYAAPVAAAVTPTLVQLEELAATLKAKKLMHQAKIPYKNLGKMMGKQQLGYLLRNLGAVTPVAGGALALHHYLKQKDTGKNEGKDV